MVHSAMSLASYGRKTWKIIAAWGKTRSDGSGALRFEGEFVWHLFLVPGLWRDIQDKNAIRSYLVFDRTFMPLDFAIHCL